MSSKPFLMHKKTVEQNEVKDLCSWCTSSPTIAYFVFLASSLLVNRHSTYGLQIIQTYNHLLMTRFWLTFKLWTWWFNVRKHFLCCIQIGRPLYTQDSVSPVGGGAARQQTQSVLLVDEVRDVDQGTYSCTAHNLQGAKSVSTTVKVVPKTKPKKPWDATAAWHHWCSSLY